MNIREEKIVYYLNTIMFGHIFGLNSKNTFFFNVIYLVSQRPL